MWIVYCLFEGKRDGEFYHNRITSTNPSKDNIHWLFSTERLFIGGLLFIYLNTFCSLLNNLAFIISLGLIFSYFHNGMYYLERNRLLPGIYPKKWLSSSITSSSWIELNYNERFLLLLLGGILLTTLIK